MLLLVLLSLLLMLLPCVAVSVTDVAAVCCCLSPAAADAHTVAGLVPGLDPQHPVVAHRHLLHLTGNRQGVSCC